MESSAESIVRTWFREVWDEGNEDAIDRLMAPYGVVYGLPGGPVQGPTAFKPLVRTLRGAIADLRIEVVRTIAEGDMVAAHYHVTGRTAGAAPGGDPTQQPVDFWGMTMIRVEDGRIVQAWNCVEMLATYQQIGWITIPPAV